MKNTSKQAPFGLVVITVIDVISMALLPLSMLYISATTVELANLLQIGIFSIASTVILSILITYYAYKTYKGCNQSKNRLLTLIAIYVALIIFNNLTVLLNPQQLGIDELTSQQRSTIIANMTRPSILLLINFFYFRSKKALDYLTNF